MCVYVNVFIYINNKNRTVDSQARVNTEAGSSVPARRPGCSHEGEGLWLSEVSEEKMPL